MKTFLVMLAALLPFTASADFRPGRVRTDAAATLKIDYATGVYKGTVKTASLKALITDGVQNITGYTLVLDGQAISFRVKSTKGDGSCGITQEAYLNEITTGEAQVSLTVTDMSVAMCERMIRGIWEVTLTNTDITSGKVSTLVLSGNPERYMHTL